MKHIQLIHNPGSGDEQHTKEQLITLLKKNGYTCSYASTKKKGWKNLDENADILVIAGGDGTVRKVAEEVLNVKLLDKPGPMALLPLGTANNISRALKLDSDPETVIASWSECRIKSFDIGRIYSVPDRNFFVESFGYGVFPYLMQVMKKEDDEFLSPEENLKKALEALHKILQTYEPKQCHLEIDGTDHSGKFLLAEVMNTPSIGPNLAISPLSDPGDGEFEVVLVPEQQKAKFMEYIAGKIDGREETYSFHTLKGRNIKISWEGTHAHVDDQIVKLEKGEEVTIQLKRGLLEFFVSE